MKLHVPIYNNFVLNVSYSKKENGTHTKLGIIQIFDTDDDINWIRCDKGIGE